MRTYRRWLRGMFIGWGVRAADAEDLVGDVMANVVRGIAGLKSPTSFDGWLASIATNVRHEYWTRIAQDREHLAPSAVAHDDGSGPDGDGSIDLFDRADPGQSDPVTALCVQRQLRKLQDEHPRHYACVVLIARGMKPEEIAAELGRNAGATRQFMSQSTAYAWRYVQVCFDESVVAGRTRGKATIDDGAEKGKR